MTSTGRRLASLLVALALPAAVAGCGGSKGSSSQASPDAWAGQVCSDLGHWQSTVSGAMSTLGRPQQLSVDKVHQALDQIGTATQALVHDLETLGPPDTQAGAQAEQELTTLSHQIDHQLTVISQAKDSGSTSVQGLLATASTVTAAAQRIITDTQEALTKIQGLNGGAELQKAFQNASSCQALRASAGPAG